MASSQSSAWPVKSGSVGVPHQRIVSPIHGLGLQGIGGLEQPPSIWAMPSFSALTEKELAQLMDICEGWGPSLIKSLLEWDQGDSPPLRMNVEFILAALPWLGLQRNNSRLSAIDSPIVNEELESFVFGWDFDWARVLSPFLKTCRAVRNGQAVAPSSACYILDGDVSTATRADETEVDLSLWNVGGDAPGMEATRAVIRNWLHSLWRRGLTKEATQWLCAHGAAQGPVQLSRNLDTMLDCITRAAHSSWGSGMTVVAYSSGDDQRSGNLKHGMGPGAFAPPSPHLVSIFQRSPATRHG